jgi:hypothetical protein
MERGHLKNAQARQQCESKLFNSAYEASTDCQPFDRVKSVTVSRQLSQFLPAHHLYFLMASFLLLVMLQFLQVNLDLSLHHPVSAGQFSFFSHSSSSFFLLSICPPNCPLF